MTRYVWLCSTPSSIADPNPMQNVEQLHNRHNASDGSGEDTEAMDDTTANLYDEDDEDGEDILASSPAGPIRKNQRTDPISHKHIMRNPKRPMPFRDHKDPQQLPKKPKTKAKTKIDDEQAITRTDLEAFGQSIATQIARFMGQFKGSGRPTADDMWSFPLLPQDGRPSRLQQMAERLPSTNYRPSPGKRSIWALPEEATPPPRSRKVPREKVAPGRFDELNQTWLNPPRKGAFGHSSASLADPTLMRSVATNQSGQKQPSQLPFSTKLFSSKKSMTSSNLRHPADYSNTVLNNPTAGHGETISLLDDKATSSSEDEVEPTESSVQSHQGPDKDYTANTSRSLTGALPGHDGSGEGFTLQEDDALQDLVEKKGASLGQVMSHFPGKSVHALQSRYYKHVQKRRRSLLTENRKPPQSGAESKEPVRRPLNQKNPGTQVKQFSDKARLSDKQAKAISGFTDKDDRLLVDLHERANMPFHELAQHFPGKSARNLQERYSAICETKAISTKEVQSSRLSGFSPEEDALIMELFHDDEPPSFKELESYFPGRSSTSILDRHQALLDSQGRPKTGRSHQAQSLRRGNSGGIEDTRTGVLSDADDDSAPEDPFYRKPAANEEMDVDFDLLIDLKEYQKLSWNEITTYFPQKKKSQLFYIYYRKLGRGRQNLPYTTPLVRATGVETKRTDMGKAQSFTQRASNSSLPTPAPHGDLPEGFEDAQHYDDHYSSDYSGNSEVDESENIENGTDSSNNAESNVFSRKRRDLSQSKSGRPFGKYIDPNLLIELKEVRLLSWREIMEYFPDDNEGRVKGYYYRTLSHRPDGPRKGSDPLAGSSTQPPRLRLKPAKHSRSTSAHRHHVGSGIHGDESVQELDESAVEEGEESDQGLDTTESDRSNDAFMDSVNESANTLLPVQTNETPRLQLEREIRHIQPIQAPVLDSTLPLRNVQDPPRHEGFFTHSHNPGLVPYELPGANLLNASLTHTYQDNIGFPVQHNDYGVTIANEAYEDEMDFLDPALRPPQPPEPFQQIQHPTTNNYPPRKQVAFHPIQGNKDDAGRLMLNTAQSQEIPPRRSKPQREQNPLRNATITGVQRTRTSRLSRYDKPSLLVVIKYKLNHSEELAPTTVSSPSSESEDELNLDFTSHETADAYQKRDYPRTLSLPRSGFVIQSLFPQDPSAVLETDNDADESSLSLHDDVEIAAVNGGPGADPKFRKIMPKPSNAKRLAAAAQLTPLSSAQSKGTPISSAAGGRVSGTSGRVSTKSITPIPVPTAVATLARTVPRSTLNKSTPHTTSAPENMYEPLAGTWLFVGDSETEEDVYGP